MSSGGDTVTKPDRIFVQIAAYRDPQLVPTLRDCVAKADASDALVFGICWQHATDTLEEFATDPRCKIIDMLYTESKGPCYARNKIQALWSGEEFTLHLDSHHRFIKGWDTHLKRMYRSLQERGVTKPLITAYLPSFMPHSDPLGRDTTPYKISVKEYTADGSILFIPERVDNWQSLKEPIPTAFYSGHFAFTRGEFCREVPHDPAYYFTGEEMSISVRAWTHGYDLFHPPTILAYHEYTRVGRRKHWEDDVAWWRLDAVSKRRNRALFRLTKRDEVPPTESERAAMFGSTYGFGVERRVEDYMARFKLDYYNRPIYEGRQRRVPVATTSPPLPDCTSVTKNHRPRFWSRAAPSAATQRR